MIDDKYRNDHWREAKKFVLQLLPDAVGKRCGYGDCEVAANLNCHSQRLLLGACNKEAGMGWAWIYAAQRLGWKPEATA